MQAIMDDELERGGGSASCDHLQLHRLKNPAPLGKNNKCKSMNIAKPSAVRCTDDEEEVTKNPAALPSLSSTNYGGMYVISSYKDNITTS